MESTELVLVRHASSTRREVGIWGRRYDVPLAEGFERQLEHSRRYVEAIQNFVLVSSPLKRCLETAAFLAPNHPIEVIHELTAYHSGAMEDLSESDIAAQYPGYLELSYAERFVRPKFGEESLAEQALRVGRGLGMLLGFAADSELRSIVVVAHYSSINVIGHMAINSWDVGTYGSGVFDLEDGELLRLSIDAPFVRRQLQDFIDGEEV
ncbi:MAG: histidine phosphatase family protein [Tetrasphaera sp.]